MTIAQAKEKLLNVARAEIGYHESGDNYIKYAEGSWDNQFYGWELQNQPWCDVFVDWCFCQAFGMQKGAAMTYQRVGSGSALCSASASYYQSNGAFSYTPEVGDQVFFYYGGAINHTGIVEKVEGNTLITIEGNTSDQVARRTYSLGSYEIAGYGHPKWSLVTDSSEDEDESSEDEDMPISIILRKGMVGPEVRQLQEKLIKLGYDCGPDGADGEFGINTLIAVENFQRDNGLFVDGEVGPDTMNAINKALKNQPTFKVGEIVDFIGDKHYQTAISNQAFAATPGKAKITLISKNKNTKHPYHLVHIDNTSNVYGWVDADEIKRSK